MTLVAARHYFYLRDLWVATGKTPTVFRDIHRMITVPLLMVEFYLILSAITKVPAGVFWRLIIGTFVMLAGGYAGEAGYLDVWAAFAIGMGGWVVIIWEIFHGRAGELNANSAPPAVPFAFSLMRWVVLVGWVIYLLGAMRMQGLTVLTELLLLVAAAVVTARVGPRVESLVVFIAHVVRPGLSDDARGP